MSIRLLLAISLLVVSCWPLPRLWSQTPKPDDLDISARDSYLIELYKIELQKPLDSNQSAIHLKGKPSVLVDIPTYMHVVSKAPDAVTDGTLRRQLEVMNEDYAPSGIHFDMKGITRTSDDDWGQHEDKLALHKSLRMGGYSTLNIFYIDGFNQNHKNLATATYPKGYDRYSDDFWLDGCTLHIGTLPGGTYIPYNLGRTTTHEVGHWLGLYHTFEGEECEGEGDMVDDTPPQAVAATKGCGRQDSCPVVEGWDDVTNFMDYGNDECMDGFTAGQARRMHVLWEKYRAGR